MNYICKLVFKSPKILLILLACQFLLACKNELELNAPYKEVPFVYALLNPQDKQQMIRVNKVFLGEGDANQMAKVADSVNYPAGELKITLTRFVNGKQVNASVDSSVILFKETEITTQPGAFSTTQRVYVTDKKIYTEGEYRLKIENRKTGNVFTASALAIDSLDADQANLPFTTALVYPYPSPQHESAYIDYSVQNKTYNIIFSPRRKGSLYADSTYAYNLIVRTHFMDESNAGVVSKYADFDLGILRRNQQTQISNSRFFKFEFTGGIYFSGVGIDMGRQGFNDNIFGRKVYKMEYIVHTTTREYMDFLQFSAPSLNIAQSKPLYSNFDDKKAYGIFCFRARCSITKEPSAVFVNEFARNSNTCIYRFKAFDNSLPGCR